MNFHEREEEERRRLSAHQRQEDIAAATSAAIMNQHVAAAHFSAAMQKFQAICLTGQGAAIETARRELHDHLDAVCDSYLASVVSIKRAGGLA